jgi:preprotein translocase subunit SecG
MTVTIVVVFVIVVVFLGRLLLQQEQNCGVGFTSGLVGLVGSIVGWELGIEVGSEVGLKLD